MDKENKDGIIINHQEIKKQHSDIDINFDWDLKATQKRLNILKSKTNLSTLQLFRNLAVVFV